MIERATAHRLDGDWRAACAAANVDVAFTLDEIARDHGTAMAAAVAEDLRHLVPDLVRWNLPRTGHGRTTVAARRVVLLADYFESESLDATGICCGCDCHLLYVETPTLVDGPQRLRLGFGVPRAALGRRPLQYDYWLRFRHLWDSRHTGELLRRCGGGDRAPFFHRDGTPLGEREKPRHDPGPDDPVAHAEWVTGLLDAGRIEAALESAGIGIDAGGDAPLPLAALAGVPLAAARLPAELPQRRWPVQGLEREEAEWEVTRPGGRSPAVGLRRDKGRGASGIVLFAVRGERRTAALPHGCLRPPDLDLLRAGLITPEELHPLVRSALFPERPPATGPVGPPAPARPEPVRVRCRDGWHEVRPDREGLRTPHDRGERERERAMAALGGPVAGCFAAERAWNLGTGRLPRGLREQRDELFLRAQHGDTPGVLLLLDEGADAHVRDGRRRTLLHYLHKVDHRELLPRLLAAGLDLEARDRTGRTPLHLAAGEHGSEELVRALLAAGARIDVLDRWDLSLRSVIRRRNMVRRNGRPELVFLAERVTREFPGLQEMIKYDVFGRLH
ncbi:ankyrin repeat domain-containing protein [Spirillospora sp. NPDC029432]|uniref:ankyrin repeat domain-containing protein n=1 Tax=Spirillospora sp. NPDC029432 TaxID=3154599 RepID=UPI003454A9D1